MDHPQALVNAYLDNELTERQHRALTAWLAEDPSHVEQFVLECYLHSQLQDIFTEERITSEALSLQSELQEAGLGAMNVGPLLDLVPGLASPPPIGLSPTVPTPVSEPEECGFPQIPGLGGLGGAMRQVTQVGLVPYLVFASLTLLLCLVVQLIWEWNLTGRQPVAQVSPATILVSEERVLAGAGYVSGMTGCQWGEGSRRPACFDRVAVGEKFHLEAGLLEITYDSGFQAILQGPAQYEITSPQGGYLTVGKLTGKANTVRARGFTIDTPTARVTDLGTEFGTEVASNGSVETVVFAGEVQLTAVSAQTRQGPAQVLRTGEAAQVLRDSDGANPIVQLVAAALGERFMRAMPPAPVQVLIDPATCNGSFEEPAVNAENCDAAASDPATQVYAKTRGVVPRCWTPTFALQTKGAVVRGVTGQQYVVLQGPSFIVFSTRLDGAGGHPPLSVYAPQTVYVLSVDLGADVGGVKAHLGLDDGAHAVRQTVTVASPGLLEPVPPLVLDTAAHPEFVGKPIGVSFMRAGSSANSRLYLDNVVLRAFPKSP